MLLHRHRQSIARLQPAHAHALRTEQGLHDQGMACHGFTQQHLLRVMARFTDPGGRRGHAMMMQQEASHGLVYRALDGVAIVIDQHTQHLQRMQDIEPGNYLLQRATGHAADEHAGRQPVFKTGNDDAGTTRQNIQRTILERDKYRLQPPGSKSLAQALAVPAGVVREYRNSGGGLHGKRSGAEAEGLVEQRRIQLAAGKALAGFQRSDRDGGWAEQHGVDLVEIHVHCLEHFGERPSIVT